MSRPIYRYENNGILIEETEENFREHFSDQYIWVTEYYISVPSLRFFFTKEAAKRNLRERMNNLKFLNGLKINSLLKHNGTNYLERIFDETISNVTKNNNLEIRQMLKEIANANEMIEEFSE